MLFLFLIVAFELVHVLYDFSRCTKITIYGYGVINTNMYHSSNSNCGDHNTNM